MSARWLRLDTTWSSSEWLAELSPASRLVWVELLCYTKAHGYNGRVRSVSHSVFALRHVTGVTRNDVTELIEAAKADKALIEEGDEWVLTGWPERNGDPTASERQKRYRKSKSRLSPLRESRVTDRYVTPVTPTETETTTETDSTTTTTGEGWPEISLRSIASLYGVGRPGTDESVWYGRPNGTPLPDPDDQDERKRLVRIATDRLEGEGVAYQARVFRSTLLTVIREQHATESTSNGNGRGKGLPFPELADLGRPTPTRGES